MTPVRRWSHSGRWALAGVALAACVLAKATVEAWTLESVSFRGTRAAPATRTPESTQTAAPDDSLVLATLARHPFRPERRPGPARYRLPGEELAERGGGGSSADLRLLGTVSSARGRGLAAFEAAGRTPWVARLGDTVEGLTLTKVARGLAVLEGRDSLIVLRLDAFRGGAP